MQKHFITDSEQKQPAETRVTATELVSALAALQARREASAENLAGTIALGEAVRELALDATPQEILTEVKAQRTAQTRRARQMPKRWKAVVFAFTTFCLLTGAAYNLGAIPGYTPHFQIYQETTASLERKLVVRDPTGPAPVLRTLAEVPQEQTVFCTAEGVNFIVTSRMASTGPAWLSDNSGTKATWRIVKLGRDIYLRGWVPAHLTPQALAAVDRLTVYNTPTAPALGSAPVPISVKLTVVPGFSPFLSGPNPQRASDRTWEAFTFSNFHPNAHTWAKW